MSLRTRPTLKHRKSGGTDRRRRHRHSEGETRLPRVARAALPPAENDIEDYMYAAWGAFLADEAGARAGC
jgi:hypothetical protein